MFQIKTWVKEMWGEKLKRAQESLIVLYRLRPRGSFTTLAADHFAALLLSVSLKRLVAPLRLLSGIVHGGRPAAPVNMTIGAAPDEDDSFRLDDNLCSFSGHAALLSILLPDVLRVE